MKKTILILVTTFLFVASTFSFAYQRGDCVEFSIVGTGLLNGGKTIYVKGQVTTDAGSSSFVKIISMRGGNSFYHGGKDYYKGDEIEVPNSNLESCS